MPPRESARWLRGLAAALLAGLPAAPGLAGEPFSFAGGWLRLGGEASGTFSGPDRAYFNYTDYERSNLRLFRLNLDAEVKAGPHVAFVGEVRTDNLDSPRPYALYLRLRPWTSRSFDVQAGRIPPVFGSYARRRYAADNPLPGMPLAYQYLTTLRPDALPSSADDLYDRQGSGWLVRYPIGAQDAAPGMPLVNAERWDVGVEARIGSEPVELAVALTQGTLSPARRRTPCLGRIAGRSGSMRPASTPSTPPATGYYGRRRCGAAGTCPPSRGRRTTAWTPWASCSRPATRWRPVSTSRGGPIISPSAAWRPPPGRSPGTRP